MYPKDPIPLWQHLHGATVHFAIALTLVSLFFDLGSLVLHRKEWRTVGFWGLVIGALFSLPAILSGLWGQLGWFKADVWTADHLLQHRNLALISSGALVALMVWRVLSGDFGVTQHHRDQGRNARYRLYLGLMVLAVAAVSYVGYLGGYVARGY